MAHLKSNVRSLGKSQFQYFAKLNSFGLIDAIFKFVLLQMAKNSCHTGPFVDGCDLRSQHGAFNQQYGWLCKETKSQSVYKRQLELAYTKTHYLSDLPSSVKQSFLQMTLAYCSI